MEQAKHPAGAPAEPAEAPRLGDTGKATLIVEEVGDPQRDGVDWVGAVGRETDGRRTAVFARGAVGAEFREAYEVLKSGDFAGGRVVVEFVGRWIHHAWREVGGERVSDLRLAFTGFRCLGRVEAERANSIHDLLSAHRGGRPDEVRARLDRMVRESADARDRRAWLTPPPFPPEHEHAAPRAAEDDELSLAVASAFSGAVPSRLPKSPSGEPCADLAVGR